MREGKAKKKPQPRPKRRVRLFLFLTDSEKAELEGAARESGACSRGLVITEAVKIGLREARRQRYPEMRNSKVSVRIPRQVAVDLKQFAQGHYLTQSLLLRHFLFQYLAKAPWKAVITNVHSGKSAR